METIKFHRVIFSTDDSVENIEYWPFIASAWNTWYPEISVELAYVTSRDENSPMVRHMSKFGNVHIFRDNQLEGVSKKCIVEASKILLTCMIGDGSICVLSDLHSFPLNRSGYAKSTESVEQNRVLILNDKEIVVNSDYLNKVLNPSKKPAGDLVKEWSPEMENFNPVQFFTNRRTNGVKINSIRTKDNIVDMRRSGVIEMSKLWGYEYDKCVIPPVPFSMIQQNIKILSEFVGTNVVRFEGVETNPKPHWIGIKEPAKT